MLAPVIVNNDDAAMLSTEKVVSSYITSYDKTPSVLADSQVGQKTYSVPSVSAFQRFLKLEMKGWPVLEFTVEVP